MSKWYNLRNTPQNTTKFSAMLGEIKKNPRKILHKNMEKQLRKMKKDYSQDLVKQTVV